MFLQVPFPQGCLSHSSTSETKEHHHRSDRGLKVRNKRPESGHLTDTHGLVPCHFEAIGADAAIAPQGVDALTRVTDARVLGAFITI